LRDNSEKSVIRVIGLSIGSATFIYELVAILGYISFGKDVKGNIILECKIKKKSTKWLILVLI
jgi:amino acid permease